MKISSCLTGPIWTCRFLAGLGSFLLLVAILGGLGVGSGYQNFPPRPGERFDPELARTTHNFTDLFHAAQQRAGKPLSQLPPAQAMAILYGVTADRFTHGDRAQYNFMNNWLIWLMSRGAPSLGHILQPDVLLARGHSALCDQVSYVLVCLARETGIPCRHLGLDGHVVMEAWYDNAYHLYDPDLEIIPCDDNGRVLARRELVDNPELARRCYADKGPASMRDELTRIITGRQKTSMEYFPPGDYDEVTGLIRYRIHCLAGPLQFILPVMMMVAGFGGLVLFRWLHRKYTDIVFIKAAAPECGLRFPDPGHPVPVPDFLPGYSTPCGIRGRDAATTV